MELIQGVLNIHFLDKLLTEFIVYNILIEGMHCRKSCSALLFAGYIKFLDPKSYPCNRLWRGIGL
jgi:hypothetical protein